MESELNEFDAMEYECANNAPCRADAWQSPEHKLWSAVLALAIEDARGCKGAAREWLFSDNSDFFMVCSLAGISPVMARRAAANITQPA